MVGLGTGAPIVQVYHEKSIILPDVSRVLACLYEKDIKFETHTASYKSLLRLQASSHAPVPFCDGPTFLEESRGICRYIAEKYEHQGYPFLLGKDALERASVEQWLHNEEHAFNPPSRALYCHLAFPLDEDGDDIDMHTRKLEEVLEVYEQRLSDSRFLAGNKFTLADLVHLPNSHYITASDKFVYLYDSRKNVSRWWDEISNRKSWQQVLRDMKRVEEEQNRQEELKKKQRQQRQQNEHPRTSGHPIRIDSRTQIGTEPRTILVPPADTVSSSSIVPPQPTDTFPSEALVSSSQTTPTDKTSAVLSKETTVFNAPDEKPPTSVQSTPTTSIKHPIPVQSIKDDASPTTAKKPPVAYAAKSSTQDASIPEPTVKDLHTRHKPSSSKDGSNNLDVFDYYPSHTDEETPYIEPTTRRKSDMLDAFSGSNIAAGHTKTSSISAKEPDQPSVSDFHKSHSRATGGQDTNKQPRDPASVPRQRAAQDARGTFGESKAADSTIPSESFPDASGSSLSRQDLDAAHHTTAPFQKRYPGTKDTSKQAKDKISTPWPMADKDAEDTTEETQISDSSSSQVRPSYFQKADAPPWKQETTEDRHSGTSAIQEKHANVRDTTGISRDVAFKPKQTIGQDDQDTFEETKSGGPSLLRDQQTDTWQVASSLPEQEVNQDGRSVAPPSQTRYPSSTPPSKTRYQIAKDASKQPTGTAPTSKKKAGQDDEGTSEESNTYNEIASTEQPLSAWRTISPRRQEVEDSSRMNTSFQKRYPDDGDGMQVADTASASQQIVPDGRKDIFEETKPADSTTSAKPVYTQEAAPPLPRQAEVEDAQGKGRQSRVTIPEPQEMVARNAQVTHGERKTTTPGEQFSDRLQAIPQSRPAAAKDVQSATGASTAHHATTDDKFSKQSIIDERVGEPTKIQASTPAHIAAPDGHSELVSIPDGQISEAAKTRHDQATLQEDVHDTNLPILDVAKGTFKETKVADSTPSSAKPMYTQQPGHAEVEDTRNKGAKSREAVPDRQKMVERSAGTAGEQLSDRLKAIPPSRQAYREDTIDDQKVAPPLLSRELTSQVQPPSEPSHDAALHGDLSSKPSTVDQWRHASAPLHDVTTGSGDDEVAMPAVDQKPTPMRQQESDEQRVGPPVPKAETSGVQRASPSFLGAPVDDHATIGDKFANQSIIDERVGKPIQMQPSSPDAHPASELTKRATPEGHETGDSDGQLSEATKARDRATVHENVNDVNLLTHDVGKDTFKETKVADSTPSNAKPMYTQQPSITSSWQTQVKEARDKSMQSRETIPEQQKMVERKPSISGEQSSDYKKAIHPSRQVAAAEDAPNGDRIQFPYIPDSSKKSRVTFEEAIGPGSTLPKAQALDSQDSQLTKGESTMPTADQRKDRKDAKDDETVMTEEKSFSTERLREMFQESESTTPKTQPIDSQDYSMVDKTFPVYQKGPLAAQIIQAGEKMDSSTPEHQESSGAPYTYDEKLSASPPARADIRDDHSAEEPYKKYTADDQKVAPSQSSKEPASQVQPLAAPFQRAVPDGDSPSKQFTIDQWQRASAPLNGVSADSASKQMHEPITAAHPASASTIRTTPDGHEAGGSKLVRTPEDLEAAKATQDPDTIHEDVHDASLSTHDAAIDENTATYHASGDELITGYVHDRQAHPPASTQAQTTVETPRDSSQYEQKSTPSDKGSSHAAQPLSSVEPIKEDSNVSATDYANAPQMIFRQQARPSAPSTIGIPASDTQGVIGKIQEVTPDNRRTDDSEQVADASQAIPGQEEMTSPPRTTVFPISDAQLASAEIQEVIPDDKQAVESITPLFSNGKQGSHVEFAFGPGEVGPPEKKFAPSDQELPHSAEQPTFGKPRKEQTVIPTAEQIKRQPTVIGQKDTPDTREALISEDVLDTTPTHGDVHPTGSIEPDSRPLSIKGEETQEPPPRVAKDSLDTEDISTDALGNVQSLKPSTTPGALHITTGSTPGDVAMAEQTSSTSGQDSAAPAEPAFPLGPRNKEIRDSTPSGLAISSTDPSKRDAIVAVPDQAKDLQTIPSGQDILSTQHPSGKVQETVPGDDSDKDKPFRPSSAVREGEPSKVVPASVPGIQLGSAPNEVAFDEQKFSPSGQDSAYPAQPPSSAEARSKQIGDLAPSAQLNSTTEPRNGDGIVAAPDQAKDSEKTSGQQVKLSAPSSYTQRPSGTLEEDEPADNPGQDSAHTTLPAPAPGTQYGTELHKADDEQKFASSGQDSARSVQPAFSSDEQTKEDTVAAATDQTNTLEKIIDQKDTTPAPDQAKPPFSGAPDASRETQKSTDDDHIDEKHPSQGRISPYRHVSEPPEGPTPEVHSDVVIKETTLGSSQEETSKTRPDSTPISGDVQAASSLPETQDLQGSAYARNGPADSLQNIESPGHISSDQALAPIMSPSVPSVAPLGTNSVQPPRKASMASTVDLESVPDTQHGIPRGEATPDEQKFDVSDQELPHTLELLSSAKTRKEEVNAATGDQPNVPQGPETVRHQVKTPSDARETLRKDQQPSGAALPEQITHAVLPSDLRDQPTPEVGRTVVDKETTLLSSQAQTSAAEPDSTPISGDVLPTDSLQNQDAQPPAATQAPPTQSLQGSAPTHDDSLGKFESTRQASTDQVMAPVSDSAAPSDASQVTETGQDSAASVQPPFSSEPTEDNTVVSAADETKDMETATHQQAIAPAPESAKTPFPGTQDASRKIQESTPDNGHIYEPFPSQEQMLLGGSNSQPREGQITDPYGTNVNGKTGTSLSSQANSVDSGSDFAPTHTDVHPSVDEGPAGIYFPVPGAQKQLPAATQDVSLDSSSKTKSTGQESMAPTRDLASSPDTQLDSSQTKHEASPVGQKFAVSDQGFSSASKSPSFAEPRKEETNAGTADQISVPQTTAAHKVPSATSDARESLWKDQESSRDGDYISNSANELVVSEGKASRAGNASEGPNSEVSSAVVDKKMTLPSSQAQTSSTGPESTPISGDSRLSSADVSATNSLQNEEVHTPQVPTTQVPLGSASTQNVPADALGEIRSPRQPSTDQVMSSITSSTERSDAPQGTEPDQVSAHASEPPFSAEPSNEASHAARAPESHEGTTPQVHSPVVDANTTFPSRQVQTANAGPDSTPISGDVPDRSSLQNQEAQLSAATQVPAVQAQGSASTKNEPVDSLGDIKSPRQLPTDEVVAPITSFAAPSDSSQGNKPGINSVQPSEEASFDFSSDKKPTTTQGDQAKTLPNGDLPTSQVVGQSESEDSRRVGSQENLKGASTNENPKTQQQIEQFNTQSFKENNKEADERGNQQRSEQAIVDSPEGNENQAEQTKLRDTETGGPEDTEASENTNQKNNRISQVETSDRSGKEASGVQQLGENTKDAPNSTEDAPGDVHAISKSKESSRSSEEPKLQLQSKDETGETESPSSETGQPSGDLPTNSYQNDSRQSQAEASDKSEEQSYPGTPNKDRDSGRSDDLADPTKPGDMED
ncbi:hypothetical protein C2845_PM03G05080 [Panicum miliaceum]|uniref:glutathione transferase n=1 Tax=Panicum miliaceum TaxID=4540 RepID=A0A3L6TBQ9_PANMI|nr:hypothetical protein C2845_PM03G05080 [Panicum miliaceum]